MLKAKIVLGLVLLASALIGSIYHVIIICFFPIRSRFTPRLLQMYSKIISLIFRIKFTDLEIPKVLQRDHDGVILIANHTSFLDILILSSAYRCNFVSKSEIFFVPFIGTGAWLLGVRFLKRGSIKASVSLIKLLSQNIRRNETIVVFPQGTTGSAADKLPFKRGLFKVIAMNSKVVFQPVSIVYESDEKVAWGDESLLKNISRLLTIGHINVSLVAHPLINQAGSEGKSAGEIAEEAYNQISSALVPV